MANGNRGRRLERERGGRINARGSGFALDGTGARNLCASRDCGHAGPPRHTADGGVAGTAAAAECKWKKPRPGWRKFREESKSSSFYPSWLIFADGFRFSSAFRLVRRALNFAVALIGLSLPCRCCLLLCLRSSWIHRARCSTGRSASGGRALTFYCYKFRTMREDAEADTGATWARDDDPRITRVGKFLRSSRLDEIPQLWCVLKGDMHFVGPRPERPEFVEWLSKEIPYYGVRHVVRPGITGWAQVRYKYGNTLEDAREKLQYDLFYIKNASSALDLLIMFQTIKIVLLGRGAK